MDVVTLSADATSPAAARRMVLDALAGVDPEICGAVELLTSELVTNVVRHAETEVRVTIDPGPPIRVEVHNHLAATAAFREMISTRPALVATGAPGGRGLGLVHDLADRVGLAEDNNKDGKVVWFEFDLD